MMALEIDLVLVAADGSTTSERAAERAVVLADRYDADLHLLHFVDTRLMDEIRAGELSADAVAGEQQSLTGAVRERLSEDGEFSVSAAANFSSTSLAQTPGTVILDVSEEVGADFVVVPRQSPSGDPGKALGKAALSVLEHARQPVLSV